MHRSDREIWIESRLSRDWSFQGLLGMHQLHLHARSGYAREGIDMSSEKDADRDPSEDSTVVPHIVSLDGDDITSMRLPKEREALSSLHALTRLPE